MIEIKPIQINQITQAKQVIAAVCQEFWSVSPEELFSRWDSMSDIDNVETHYSAKKGIFLVICDDERVVGTGAIRYLDNNTCELKRMWLLKDYRGQGLGIKLAQALMDFAKKAGYRKVLLDLFDKKKQFQAIAFYHKLGFQHIEAYNDGPCTVFMEKLL